MQGLSFANCVNRYFYKDKSTQKKLNLWKPCKIQNVPKIRLEKRCSYKNLSLSGTQIEISTTQDNISIKTEHCSFFFESGCLLFGYFFENLLLSINFRGKIDSSGKEIPSPVCKNKLQQKYASFSKTRSLLKEKSCGYLGNFIVNFVHFIHHQFCILHQSQKSCAWLAEQFRTFHASLNESLTTLSNV